MLIIAILARINNIDARCNCKIISPITNKRLMGERSTMYVAIKNINIIVNIPRSKKNNDLYRITKKTSNNIIFIVIILVIICFLDIFINNPSNNILP